MDKNSLIKKLTAKNIEDYSYAIIFFLTFSFFVLVVIKPNITTVFSLQKELDELKVIDESYNGVIDKIINIQTLLESSRDQIYLIEEAVPTTPQLNSLISNIRQIATESNVVVNQLSVSEINLKKEGKRNEAELVQVDFETTTSFEGINNFIMVLQEQRRLKTIDNISISSDTKGATDSGKLNVSLIINGYYL